MNNEYFLANILKTFTLICIYFLQSGKYPWNVALCLPDRPGRRCGEQNDGNHDSHKTILNFPFYGLGPSGPLLRDYQPIEHLIL